MKTRTKVWLLAIVGLLLVVGVLVGVKVAQIRSMIEAGKSFQPPPESVASAKVEAVELEPIRAAVGTLVAARGVQLGAELAGLVREVSYDSGAAVRRGEVLVRLDTSTEEAQLAAARADAALARLALERARRLREEGSISPADLDAAEARAKAAEAAVTGLQATIAKKTIRAPFDGRLAIRQVELGQVVSPGTAVASLQSVTPIHVDFWLPQQALAELELGQRVRMRTDVFPDRTWQGEITVVNPEVDVATRNVRVRATFPNADGRLRPGMFARLEAVGAEKRRVLLLPATAVIFAPYGDSVFVIEEGKEGAEKGKTVVRQRFIRTGERRGDFVVVESGLEAGEKVVSSGAFKLRNGMAVVVNDALAPKPELAPRPAEP
jgi:membrane fusion protein (multidrug efflux system)